TLDFAMRNYKDESFINQYLSPKLIRDFRLFAVADYEDREYLEIDSIHNEHGYRRVRKLLSEQYNRDNLRPDVQIVGYGHAGDRSLRVQHRRHRGRNLSGESARVMRTLQKPWALTG